MLHTIHNVILTVFFLKFDCAAKFTDVHTMLQHNNLYQYLSTYKVPEWTACYGKKYCISRNLAKENLTNSLFNSIFFTNDKFVFKKLIKI